MDEIDLLAIQALKYDAAGLQWYELADALKKAENILQRRLHEKYSIEILNKITEG